jgi:hypothetical protein
MLVLKCGVPIARLASFRVILTNKFKPTQRLLVNMSDDQTDTVAGAWSEEREILPEEIVRYVREASSQERQAIRSLIEEFESNSESESSDSDRSENQSEAGGEQASGVRQKNETVEEGSRPIEQSDDPPDGVPANATLTVKEINNNRYYYWQWRDGDSIRSKYKGPVQDQ